MKQKIWFDKKNGEVYFNNISMFIWRRDAAGRIQRYYEKIVGPATRIIISEATKNIMRDVFSQMAVKYRRAGHRSLNLLSKKMLEELPSYGYGVPEIMFLEEKVGAAKIGMHNCFNALGYKNSSKPVCYRMEGILASLFETVFKGKVASRETKCVAMGDPHCEFEVAAYNIPVKSHMRIPRTPKNLVPEHVDFDPGKGEIVQRGINSVFFPRGDVKVLEKESERIIGRSTKGIFYMIGYIDSLASMGNMLKSLVLKIISFFNKKMFMDRLRDFIPMRGYGIPEYKSVDLKNKRYELIWHNSFNALGVSKSDRPVCYLLSGVLAGASNIIFSRPMRCEEVKCKGMGHPHCEFHVFPEEE